MHGAPLLILAAIVRAPAAAVKRGYNGRPRQTPGAAINTPVLLFDFDSTLIAVESLELLAQMALAQHPQRARRLAEMERITALAMAGRMDFAEALRRRLQLIEVRQRHLDALDARLPSMLSASVLRNLDFLRRRRDSIFVISGGFCNYMAATICALGLRAESLHANRLLLADGLVVGHCRDNPLARDGGKARVAAAIAARMEGRELLMVGDGFNDWQVRAAGVAGAFYAFTENVRRPQVVELADAEARSMEQLREILECR